FVAAAALVGLGLGFAILVSKTRRAVTPFALFAATTIVLPVALAVVKPSSDYVLPRYLVAAVVPLLIVVAAGLTAAPVRRIGLLAGVALVGIFVSMTISIAFREELQRPDWRAVGHAIGPARSDRAVVTDVNVQ